VRLPNGVFNPYTGIKTNLLFFTKGTPTQDVWFYEHPYPPGREELQQDQADAHRGVRAEKAWWNDRVENEHAWKVSADDIKNDEPASELLKRIAKERARLETEGKIKKSKPMPLVGEDEQPFALPASWAWVRLNEIGHDWGQKTPDEAFTYIDVSAIDNTRGRIASPSIVASDDAPSRARKLVRRGTVIYSTVRPYLLNIAVIDRDFSPAPIASTAFAILHPLSDLSSRFIFWFLRSPVFVRYVESVQTGIAYPAVNDAQFFVGLIPLPPILEQHRIVAKVDELMALCDRLEAEQTDARAAHTKLVETLLGTLTQSTDAAELAANWQRLAEHFNTLFTTEASLDALKQTILQLAVMGKLVPQDPNDEPASELLKRIARERARLEAEGACKKWKPVLPGSKEEQPHSIPIGWLWARLPDVCHVVTDGEHITPSYVESGVPMLSARHLGTDTLVFDDMKFVSPSVAAKCWSRCCPEERDILVVSRGGGVGRTIISGARDYCLMGSVLLFKPATVVNERYLCFYLNSNEGNEKLRTTSGASAQQAIYIAHLKRDYILPLPPLAEQHRIVAKVDELTGLCDQLKADLVESRNRQTRLSATLIESALQAA
jgi:type I restriction enzyme S subunit